MPTIPSQNGLTSTEARIAREAIVTQSADVRLLVNSSIQVARSSATLLLKGESGTGKELFVKLIHENSRNANGPLIKVNCAALSANLIESELFGHEKGSFTDAVQQRIGLFEHASGGTLLLDEISEIPLTTQAKLLRALEEREIQRVGSSATIKIDVRIIATTNRDLREEVRENRFRLDLFHRLNVIEIHVPSLRDRIKDIPLLAMHFIKMYRSENDQAVSGLTKSAMQKLASYHWPGNIRELRNTIHRACILTRRPLIDVHCLTQFETQQEETDSESMPEPWLRMKLAEIERLIIYASLQKYGSKRAAAASLGVTPRTLTNKMKVYSQQEHSELKVA